jgi:rhodanese-related sulfurtransferase
MTGPHSKPLPGDLPVDPNWETHPVALKKQLDSQAAIFLLDVRRENEWQIARLPVATLIPLHELQARIAELEPHRNAEMIVLCHHGVRSLRAVQFLRSLGFSDARSLAGGMDAYSVLADPSIPRY